MAVRVDNPELAAFFEDLGMMVQSGISVTEAVALMREDAAGDSTAISIALESIGDKLASGWSLAEAMGEAGVFPQYSIDLVGASEYTGRLEETLFNLSAYYSAESRMKSTLISAVRYPFVLLLMVTAVLAVLLIMVFPSFYGVYSSLTGSLSESSYSYINVSFALCRIIMVVLIAVILAIAAGVWLWRQGKGEKVLGILTRLKPVRELAECIDLYRFTSCFGLFVSAGENQDSAMVRSLDAAGSGRVRAILEKCRVMMAQGKSFSQAAFEERLYDRTCSRIIMSAERSGMLDSALIRVTDNLRDKAENRAADIANTAEPVLTGSMMIFTGLILVSIMLPLIGIMNSIG